eukprot:283278-Pyramimonas_sp.AAC.1
MVLVIPRAGAVDKEVGRRESDAGIVIAETTAGMQIMTNENANVIGALADKNISEQLPQHLDRRLLARTHLAKGGHGKMRQLRPLRNDSLGLVEG